MFRGGIFVLFCFFSTMLFASDYLGDQVCIECHESEQHSFLISQHGKAFQFNSRSELQSQGCEACHGPGAPHMQVIDSGDDSAGFAIENFSQKDEDGSDAICIQCHQSGQGMHWQGSGHEMANVSCVSCHQVHTDKPQVGEERCGSCHVIERAKMMRSSHMGVRDGELSCSSCHNAHGSVGESGLNRSTVNDTCYQCHAEKRGPVIWEHPPVRENCADCHDPHGSMHVAMLKTRDPYLCQQCHSNSRHPGELYDGVEQSAADHHLIGKACLNCHVQIHGSNHPSGEMFER